MPTDSPLRYGRGRSGADAHGPAGRTGLLARRSAGAASAPGTALKDRAQVLLFGAIGWPWLLRSLNGGAAADRAALLSDLCLLDHDLPPLGSWRADAGFLRLVVEHIRRSRPETVVEFGAGASTIVAARALQLLGRGRLVSFDEHADFVASIRRRLDVIGLTADLRVAPLTRTPADWPGRWYEHAELPERIDLMILDGPHWTVHPFVRGAADMLFPRLSIGGAVLLDDADRPGERMVARRWRRRWPGIEFQRLKAGSKGCLVGVRRQ